MDRSSRVTVLLADDASEVRQLLEAKFRQAGYAVTAVEDGAECLAVLADETASFPDAVVLDVMMPNVDGFRALTEIRETYGSSLPVLMLTSRGQEQDTVRALDAGATDYVTKPFSPKELVARLERHL